jgi:hypothetical protein
MKANAKRCLLGLMLLAGANVLPAADSTNRFGFSGPEIFPVENFISNLRVADLDGDGLKDIVVVNNVRARITLLYNQTGRTNTQTILTSSVPELNELPPDSRFRIDSLASEKRISSLVVEDLNGDGRPDLAYYGEPRELIAVFRESSGGWSPPKRWPLDDGQLTPNALATGDINGDGRNDLLQLAETHFYVLYQKADGTMAEPVKVPLSGPARSIQVIDADGDGHNDVLLVNWDDRYPFRLRLQQTNGELGPELFFAAPPIRSYCADRLDAGPQAYLAAVAQNSGRAQVYELRSNDADPLTASLAQGQFQVVPLPKTDRARRGLLWADLNGDGLQDLVVAEPDNGQLSVSLQQSNGTLASARTFPCLAGVSDLAVEDWDRDGKPELFLFSPEERQIGVAQLNEKQRLPFPELLSFEGRPLAMAVGPLKTNGPSALAVIVEQDSRRVLVLRRSDGSQTLHRLDEKFKSNPSTLAWHDADQDGQNDIVVLTPYEKVKVLRQIEPGQFEEIDVAPPGGTLEQPWLSTADVDGDGKAELLLTQRNFLRAVVLRRSNPAEASAPSGWGFAVKDQINGAESNSRLVGAMVLKSGTNSIGDLFLLDAERKALTLCQRNPAGVWQVTRSIPLPFSEFTRLQPVQLAQATAPSIALLGLNAAGWMRLDGPVWQLRELDGYETPIKEARLNNIVAGDLNGDGRKELVFLETGRNYVDLVSFSADHKLIPGDRWQVFEERTFRARSSGLPEPREAAIADVTGDQKNDLIILVHDRLLVYPQE